MGDNAVTLRGVSYVLGDLTAATLEDEPEAVRAFFGTPASTTVLSGEHLKAVLTLGAEAVRRGSHPALTREQFRELVQLPDLAALYVAVGKALGLGRGEAGVPAGEAQGPGSSPPSASSSGA
jgi:hypothetical protein